MLGSLRCRGTAVAALFALAVDGGAGVGHLSRGFSIRPHGYQSHKQRHWVHRHLLHTRLYQRYDPIQQGNFQCRSVLRNSPVSWVQNFPASCLHNARRRWPLRRLPWVGRVSFSCGSLRGGSNGKSDKDDQISNGLDLTGREAKAMNLYDYAAQQSALEATEGYHENLLKDLRQKTEELFPSGAHMMLGSLEASLLGILAQSIKAKRILEIGGFTGYSALSMLRTLEGTNGKILSIDKDSRCHQMAREFAQKHPQGHKIEFILGDAMEIVHRIALENDEAFDLVFIDADKKAYLQYYNTILEKNLVRVGGLIIVDNVLFRGMVADVDTDGNKEDLGTDNMKTPHEMRRNKRHLAIASALHHFNLAVAGDNRTESVLLPIRDGLTVARRIR